MVRSSPLGCLRGNQVPGRLFPRSSLGWRRDWGGKQQIDHQSPALAPILPDPGIMPLARTVVARPPRVPPGKRQVAGPGGDAAERAKGDLIGLAGKLRLLLRTAR